MLAGLDGRACRRALAAKAAPSCCAPQVFSLLLVRCTFALAATAGALVLLLLCRCGWIEGLRFTVQDLGFLLRVWGISPLFFVLARFN